MATINCSRLVLVAVLLQTVLGASKFEIVLVFLMFTLFSYNFFVTIRYWQHLDAHRHSSNRHNCATTNKFNGWTSIQYHGCSSTGVYHCQRGRSRSLGVVGSSVILSQLTQQQQQRCSRRVVH